MKKPSIPSDGTDVAYYLENILENSKKRRTTPWNELFNSAFKRIQEDVWKEGKELTYEALEDVTNISKSRLSSIKDGNSISNDYLVIAMLALGLGPDESLAILEAKGVGFDPFNVRDIILKDAIFKMYNYKYSEIKLYFEKTGYIKMPGEKTK